MMKNPGGAADRNHFGHTNAPFLTRMEAWTPLRAPHHAVFSDREIQLLLKANRTFEHRHRRLVFLSFENGLASLGGLATVTRYLPRSLADAGEEVTLVTPLHRDHPHVRKALASGELDTVWADRHLELGEIKASVTCCRHLREPFPTYLIGVEGFFTAKENPYAYADKGDLTRDALAFCTAVPTVLRELGLTENVVLHANDWETALAGITSKIGIVRGLLGSAATVLTLHNAFDAGLDSRAACEFMGRPPAGDTVLKSAIPFLDAPLVAVSVAFAHEMCHDPFVQAVLTGHLRRHLSMNPPVGIDNGLFGVRKSPFSKGALTQAGNGAYGKLLAEKRVLRKRMVREICRATDHRIRGRLDLDDGDDTTPVFFMSGRLDLVQKGFDLVFHAFREIERGSAKLFFSPSEVREGEAPAFRFFEMCAEECAGDIAIWPFRIPDERYNLLVSGAGFLLMPSLYEPFGAATEGLLHGTPPLVRGTGGLWTQVDTVLPCHIPGFYGGVLQPAHERPTGIVFREQTSPGLSVDWHSILREPPERRILAPAYRDIVDAVRDTLRAAIKISADPEEYGRLVLNGVQAVSRRFKWSRTAERYQRVYDCVSRGGNA